MLKRRICYLAILLGCLVFYFVYQQWFSLLLLLIVGGCAGSTSGGMKISRWLILFKSLKNELQRLIHPRSVKVIKLNGKMLEETTTRNVSVFLVIYCVIFGVSVLLCSLDNLDFETTVTGVLALL